MSAAAVKESHFLSDLVRVKTQIPSKAQAAMKQATALATPTATAGPWRHRLLRWQEDEDGGFLLLLLAPFAAVMEMEGAEVAGGGGPEFVRNAEGEGVDMGEIGRAHV